MARIPPSAEDMKLSNALNRRRKKVYGEDFILPPEDMRLADALNLVRQKIYGDDFIGHPSNREFDILNKLGEGHPEYAEFYVRQQERDVQIATAHRWISLNIKKKGRGKRCTVDRSELAQAMEESFSPGNQKKFQNTEEADPYKSGLPGRPNSKHLINNQLQTMWSEGRRFPKRSGEQCIMDWAKALALWLKQNHPNAPTSTAQTIKNNIAKTVHALEAAVPQAPSPEIPPEI